MPFPYTFMFRFEDYRDALSVYPSTYSAVVNKAGLDTEYTTVKEKGTSSYGAVQEKSPLPSDYEED